MDEPVRTLASSVRGEGDGIPSRGFGWCYDTGETKKGQGATMEGSSSSSSSSSCCCCCYVSYIYALHSYRERGCLVVASTDGRMGTVKGERCE